MKLLGFVTGLLLLASTAQAQLGTWPFKSGGGGGASTLSLEESVAVYTYPGTVDLALAVAPATVELSNTGTWVFNGTGWTGATSSGLTRGKLVRAAGVATSRHVVIASFCGEELDSEPVNVEVTGYIAIDGTHKIESGIGISIHNNEKPDCATAMWTGDIAAEDTVGIEFGDGDPSLGDGNEFEVSWAQILVFAPHYVPPTVNIETGNTTLTATEVSGGIITNVGASGDVEYELPAAVAGMSVTILNEAAHKITVDPNLTDRITNLTNANGDALASDSAVTSALTLISTVNNKWWGIPVGTWDDDD